MKAIVLSLLLALTPLAQADTCWMGSYGHSQIDGVGLNVEILDDVVVAYYYTDGQWFAMVGPETEPGLAELKMYSTRGPGAVVRYVGDAELYWIDNDTLVFDYYIKFDFDRLYDPNTTIPWCIGCYDVAKYSRITQPVPCEVDGLH